jgi:hypothetical protein
MASSSFLVACLEIGAMRRGNRSAVEATHAGAGGVVGPDSASHWARNRGEKTLAGQGRARL